MSRSLERGWSRAIPLVLAVAVGLGGCSGDGGSTAHQEDDLIATAEQVAGMLGALNGTLVQVAPMFLVPSAAAANGVTITPAAIPNGYEVTVPVDLDGDGTSEATVNGLITLSGDPFTFGPGFSWTFSGTVDTPAGLFMGGFTFEMLPGPALRISGAGNIGSPDGIRVFVEIDAATPVIAKIATGEADSIGNLCTHSVQGDVRVRAEREPESYSALWRFVSNRRTVEVTEAERTDEAGAVTNPADYSFQVPCTAGKLSDWAGTYDFNWFCNPQEDGDSEFVITVTGPNTIHIDDEGLEYDATAVPGYPHVVRGFFIDQNYREDFIWLLSRDGRTFTQLSAYAFLPPLTGGGLCGGTGTKR